MNNIFDKLNKDLRQEFMKVMTSQQKLSKLKYRERENKWEKNKTQKNPEYQNSVRQYQTV